MDFSSTHGLIQAGAYEDNKEPATDKISPNLEETCKMIDSVAEDLKRRLREHPLDEVIFRYKHIHSSIQLLLILQVKCNASFCSSQIWIGFWRVCYVTKVRKTVRITIQATAAGGRRKGLKKGKAPVVSERPAGSQSVNNTDKHSMHVRNEHKSKRVHNLSANIAKGAGKW